MECPHSLVGFADIVMGSGKAKLIDGIGIHHQGALKCDMGELAVGNDLGAPTELFALA